MNDASPSMKRGLVKQVLSGDAIVLQGPAINGPPKEITVYLSNVAAPRLAKRPVDSGEGSSDEPYAWEAREFVRRKIVGKTVVFVRDFIATSGREHGKIFLGGTGIHDAENISKSAVAEGWLEVRPGKQIDEYTQELLTLQEQSKLAKKGRWSDESPNAHIRNIKWQVDDLRAFVDTHKDGPVNAVVEQVRDGSTIRVFLLPTFEYLTVMISGVKCPGVKVGSASQPEPFGEEAKFFVESRLLQRDVQIYLEGVSNQNVIGSVIHPKGNIAEFLLKEGFAKCVEWSLGLVHGGPQLLREAEKHAKERRLHLWRNYVANSLPAGDRKSHTVRVIEIGLVDTMTVVKDDGSESKIYLSSIRPPRREAGGEGNTGRPFRPLYEIPYMFEAREFLRKKLCGKKVQLTLDYIQPKSEQFPEKSCYTVMYNGQNIAEQLVANGYAKVTRHRQDDDNRSSQYDLLLAAEAAAEKAKKGVWAGKTDDRTGTIRVQELQGDAARSKQFLPYLQRSYRAEGIVEFVASGSRFRVFIPKETCIITFLLGGINCPRSGRIAPGTGKSQSAGEPYGDDALNFAKNTVLQRDVQIEVESMDKAGGFIGYMFIRNDKGSWTNFAEQLLEKGLATVHFTAEKSSHYNQLVAAETAARNARINLWKDYVEEDKDETKQNEQENDVVERNLNLRKVAVSEVYRGTLHFAVQNFADAGTIEKLMKELQVQLSNTKCDNYTPRRGDLCACIFEELKLWHRARVESIKNGIVDVLYIDFGNRESVPLSRIAPLPAAFISQTPLCREYKLAFVQLPNSADLAADTDAAFQQVVFEAKLLELNVEFKAGSVEAVTLYYTDKEGNRVDVGKQLVADGLALAEKRREKRFQNLVKEYQEAEEKARRERRNIWRYGDFTGNEF